MNRIEEKMQQLREKQEKAFITYYTAGFPDLAATKQIIKAQERGGCDVIELGVPFSDPVADGPVIQNASYRAIQNGTNLENTFALVQQIRNEGVSVPIVFMLYYNTILHYGIPAFVQKCSETGVDGLVVPDLPYEEQEDLLRNLAESDRTILIQLVSPVSGARIKKILAHARGFVYCVSSMGVTGQGADFHQEIKTYLKNVREVSSIPIMMGFGIRASDDVIPLKNLIDGAIVGSHFIQIMEEKNFDPTVAETYCRKFKTELNN